MLISLGGGLEGDESEADADDAAVEVFELADLGSIFECDKINVRIINNKDGWECGWCGNFFSPRHSTRVLKHVLKIRKGDIAICKAIIPPRYLAWYQKLHGYNSNQIESRLGGARHTKKGFFTI